MNQDLETTKAALDKISPTFCAAKFLQTTVHLADGMTHSCYHPPRHVITKDDSKRVDGVHNTQQKMDAQTQMMRGVRPAECSYCWKLEDAGSLSDRHTKSGEPWAWPHLSRLAKLKPGERVNPTYVELSFSTTCQMRCSYCSPSVSSSWLADIEKHGSCFGSVPGWYDYPNEPAQSPETYVSSFWRWWNAGLNTEIEVLRVTGGEPLLDPNTWMLLEKLDKDPAPWMEFNVNSNMMVGDAMIHKLIDAVNAITTKVKDFVLYTSVDTTGKAAEYSRNGLNWSAHVAKCEKFLDLVKPEGRNGNKLSYMCTFTMFSLPNFRLLLEHILSQKKRWRQPDGSPRVYMDINIIESPEFFDPTPAAHLFIGELEDCVAFMKSEPDFSEFETSKMERLVNYFRHTALTQVEAHRRTEIFGRFVQEHDRRRKTNFIETFPQLAEFVKAAYNLND